MRTPLSVARTLRSLAHRLVAVDERTAAARDEANDRLGRIDDRAERIEHRSDDTARRTDEVLRVLTELREHERRAERVAQLAVRTGGLRGRVLRIVLLVHNTSAWESLHGVWELMAASPDIDPVVISIPKHFGGHGQLRGEDEVHADLTERGVPHLRCPAEQDPLELVQTLAPDVLFRQSQWDDDVDPRLSAENLRFTRLCLVPYEMLNVIRNVERHDTRNSAVDMTFHHEAWLVLGPAAMRDEARRSGRRQGTQFRAVGHPKLDALRAAEPRWPLPGALPRVLLSSHHSISQDWTGFGMFDEIREEALEWAREGTSEIVWSPHPYLVPFVESGHARLSAEDLRLWLKEWDLLPTTETTFDADYASLVAGSDVVITDGLSLLHEAQVVGRPVIFLEREGHVPFNEAGEVLVRGVHRVATLAQARELAIRLVRDGDPLREVQQEGVRAVFGEPGAPERILGAVLDQARAEGWRGGESRD